MKILRLELRAFGPFTDAVLDFDGHSSGLHIVYGANEAGKSSALRALRQFFYGIPHNSADDFVHSHQHLRIAALLEHSDGRLLECVRRKGNKNTLRAADDHDTVPANCLEEYLGGVSHETFSRMFGINHQELVQGGQQLVGCEGEIGKILFAAGAGITNLRSVQQVLDKEASELFAPNARTRTLNQALLELERLRKAARDAQIPGADWVKHNHTWQEACARRDQIDRQLLDKGLRRQRLVRLWEALPAIAARKQLLVDLEPLKGVPTLRREFAAERIDATTKLHAALMAEEQAAISLQTLQRDLASIDLPKHLLEQAAEISELQQELGSYQKAMRDRPQLDAQLSQLESEARLLLRCIRPDLTLDLVETLRLPDAEQIRIRNLGAQQALLSKNQRDASEGLKSIAARLESIAQQTAKLKQPREVAALKKLVRHIEKQGPLEEQLAGKQQELCEQQKQAETELSRLGLWTGTLESLRNLAMPLPETVAQFQERVAAAGADLRQAQARLAEERKKAQELAAQIEGLRIEREVPTEDDLLAARQCRDQGWELVQSRWRQGTSSPAQEQAFLEAFAPARDLAAAYEASVRKADHLADRLRREADRVERQASLRGHQQQSDQHCLQLEQLLLEAQRAHEQAHQQWLALWLPLGISPRSPREMLAWLGRQKQLLQIADAGCRTAHEAARLSERIALHRLQLRQGLEGLGEEPPGDESLEKLLAWCADFVEQSELLQSQWSKLNDELDQLQQALPAAEAAAGQAEQELKRWRTQWAAAMSGLGLPETASVEEAHAVLGRLADVFKKLHDAEGLKQRIAGIDREASAFAGQVAELAARVAPDCVPLASQRAAQELGQRLSDARAAWQRLESCEKRRAAEQKNLAAARKQTAAMQARLAALCQEAACLLPDDLPAIEERAAQRFDLQQRLQSKDEELLQRSAGMAIDDFIREAESHDRDCLQAEIDALAEQMKELQKEKDAVLQTIGGATKELDLLDGGPAGAEAAEQFQLQLAAIAAYAQQYACLRVAAAVLHKAIERYREKNQEPILARANRLFSELTLGSFQGLRVEVQESGQALLVGLRAAGSGEQVAVEHLSDGTADQLYLALRLASLERYLEHIEPLPFIVDDILIQFDNQRAAATLAVLARLALRTQVIFFTHHEHLLDLAAEHLDPATYCFHKLGESQRSLSAATA